KLSRAEQKNRTMKKKLTLIVSSLVIAGTMAVTLPSVFAQTPPPAEQKHSERHPKIRMAIRALEEAKKEMQAANHDFGGHRVAALEECDKAIVQLKDALQCPCPLPAGGTRRQSRAIRIFRSVA